MKAENSGVAHLSQDIVGACIPRYSLLAGKFVVLLVLGILVSVLLGCDSSEASFFVEGETLDAPSLQEVRNAIRGCIPMEARNIKVERHNGDFLGGASQKVKCTVSPEALRRFIQKEGLTFRFDSTVVNACKEGPRDGQFMPNIWGDFWKNDWDDAQGTGEFWSYTNVYPNYGGTRCVYFVSTETFFYDWSSN